MQMTARERTLALVVGAAVAAVLTFILVQFFLKNQKKLTSQYTEKTAMLAGMRTLIAERSLWEERDQWLRQHQPRLDNANSAGVTLLDQVKDIGQRRGLTPTEAAIGAADALNSSRAATLPYQAISVSFNVKGKWEEVVNFLHDLQSPTSFLSFEKATLQVDKEDKTLIGGSFKVARWYAPQE